MNGYVTNQAYGLKHQWFIISYVSLGRQDSLSIDLTWIPDGDIYHHKS